MLAPAPRGDPVDLESRLGRGAKHRQAWAESTRAAFPLGK